MSNMCLPIPLVLTKMQNKVSFKRTNDDLKSEFSFSSVDNLKNLLCPIIYT